MSAEQEMLARYDRSTAMLPERLGALMRNRSIDPQWLGDDDRFWYVRQTETDEVTEEYVLVDPVAGTRKVVGSLEELDLPAAPPAPVAGRLPSPDGSFSLFRRDHDLWHVDHTSGAERRLTTDGEEAFAWGELVDNNNMNVPFKRMGLVLPPVGTVFSPSGRYVLTVRVDQRAMPIRHMVEQVSIDGRTRPAVHELRVALDDELITPETQCLLIDLSTGTTTLLDTADGLGSGLMMNGSREAHWSADESALFLLRCVMGGSGVGLARIDTATGERTDVVGFEEPPLYEPNQFLYSLPLWHVLSSGAEAVLFSQRDGWGHLYLYDLSTGECRHAITSGELVVRDLLHVDEARRELTFVAGSAQDGHNPYWRKAYRASLDGGAQVLLTPEAADHELASPAPDFFHLVFGQGKPQPRSISPSGRYFIDHQSTVEQAPVILLRDAQSAGEVVLELERTDISRLQAAGYVVPTQFCVKADDGVTDLWGVLALPATPLDAAKVPVIEYIYAGYQTTAQPPSFLGGGKTSGNHAWLPMFNELGFAAVILDGRGTPGRDRTFRQWTHRQGHTTRGLEDHPHAIRELAKQHPQLDLDNVGIVGHSYGGYNAARCLLMFPDFYKAGVSSAGVHESGRMPHGSWTWFMGAEHSRTSEEYLHLGNLHLVDQLKGDLLLITGEIDENATLDHTYALVNALVKAGKRFDMKIWPGFNHYQLGAYVFMSMWDHFVESLTQAPVPRDFVPAS